MTLVYSEILVRIFALEMALIFLPFQRLVKYLGRGRLWTRSPLTEKDFRQIRWFAAGIERRLLRKPTCLRTGLILFWISPSPIKLKIGVSEHRFTSKTFETHAWVEAYGQTYIGEGLDLKQYATLLTVEK